MFAVPPNTIVDVAAGRAAVHPVQIANEFAADRERWRHLLRYDPDERWAAVLDRTDDYEVWLLSWLPGQHTELHAHGGAVGAFTLVSGRLTERVIRQDRAGRPIEVLHEVALGQSRVFGPDYVHQVRNDGPDPAVSVHVYRPGRVAMTPYHFDPVAGSLRPA